MPPSDSRARLALEREVEGPCWALGGSNGIGEGAPPAVIEVEVDDEGSSVGGGGGGFGAPEAAEEAEATS